jgi:hypothetical protein
MVNMGALRTMPPYIKGNPPRRAIRKFPKSPFFFKLKLYNKMSKERERVITNIHIPNMILIPIPTIKRAIENMRASILEHLRETIARLGLFILSTSTSTKSFIPLPALIIIKQIKQAKNK